MPTRPRCPKCGGNMFAKEDLYSSYLACMQCGLVRELTALGSLDELLAETLRPQRQKLGLGPTRA